MRARLWVIVDCSMLLALLVLQVWRLTGVPAHEWLAVVLIAPILAHLLVHWAWIETRSRRMLRPSFVLNLVLFISMTVVMVSGFAISKVVIPMHPAVPDYLKFHGLHETASRVMLACAGLHLGLNWELLFGGRPKIRAWGRPIAMIALSVAVIAGASYATKRLMPEQRVVMRRNGRIVPGLPPRDIAELRPDQRYPRAELLPLIANAAAVAVAAFIGHKLLRLD